jgi:hypothetical protein
MSQPQDSSDMCCNDGIPLTSASMVLNLTSVRASNGDANELGYVRPGLWAGLNKL